MSRIFWDTNLFIYLIKDVGDLSERVVRLESSPFLVETLHGS